MSINIKVQPERIAGVTKVGKKCLEDKYEKSTQERRRLRAKTATR